MGKAKTIHGFSFRVFSSSFDEHKKKIRYILQLEIVISAIQLLDYWRNACFFYPFQIADTAKQSSQVKPKQHTTARHTHTPIDKTENVENDAHIFFWFITLTDLKHIVSNVSHRIYLVYVIRIHGNLDSTMHCLTQFPSIRFKSILQFIQTECALRAMVHEIKMENMLLHWSSHVRQSSIRERLSM